MCRMEPPPPATVCRSGIPAGPDPACCLAKADSPQSANGSVVDYGWAEDLAPTLKTLLNLR